MSSGCKTKPAAADHARRARKATTAKSFPQKLNEEYRYQTGLASVAGPDDHDRVHVHSARGPPKYLTKSEVLERVGFSYPAVWGWMNEGKFPRAFMVAGRLRWWEHEIFEWMSRQSRQRLKSDAEATANPK
jgi:predicted DNA-binding transcriptional regulator AlpA